MRETAHKEELDRIFAALNDAGIYGDEQYNDEYATDIVVYGSPGDPFVGEKLDEALAAIEDVVGRPVSAIATISLSWEA